MHFALSSCTQSTSERHDVSISPCLLQWMRQLKVISIRACCSLQPHCKTACLCVREASWNDMSERCVWPRTSLCLHVRVMFTEAYWLSVHGSYSDVIMINGVMLGLMTACPPIKMTRLNLTSPPLCRQLRFCFFCFFGNYTSTESKDGCVKRHGWLCMKPCDSAAFDSRTVAPKFILPWSTICLLFPLGINKENQSANYNSSVAVVTIMCSCQMKKELLSLKHAPKAQCCHRELSASVSQILHICLLLAPQTDVETRNAWMLKCD